jgi:hypothetical protein
MAVTVPGVDVAAVAQRQRAHTIRALQDYTRLKARALAAEEGAAATDLDTESHDLAWLLVLDQLIFQAEAEVRWLDHCETRLVRHAERAAERAAARAADRPTRTPLSDPAAIRKGARR